jgi:hypothetical protein
LKIRLYLIDWTMEGTGYQIAQKKKLTRKFCKEIKIR